MMSTWGSRGRGRGIIAQIAACAALALTAAQAGAQPAPFGQIEVGVDVDSGLVVNQAVARSAAFSTIVGVPGATWIRLKFDLVVLGEEPQGGQPTMLVVTSLLDGAMQHHQAVTLQQWGNTSAYFNGESVRLEIVANPGAGPSRVMIWQVQAGAPKEGGLGICGLGDDRAPSNDPRACRVGPGGCSAFMISDYSNCFLSAGHCFASLGTAEFNVPLSNANGSINHPGPQDQYAVDLSSIQHINGGIGNDWSYFGCYPNTETGLTAYQAQGAAFNLAASPPPLAGQTIRVTGYGVDFVPPTVNQTQQTATGAYFAFYESTIQFQVDAQPGNSGSPVINESDGRAIGILTHGGCIDFEGGNYGTGSNNAGLQAALHAPHGLCVPAPPLGFVLPQGLPPVIDPAGASVRVEVMGANGGSPQPGTGRLHYDAGGGFVQVNMVQVQPNVYDAIFPSLECSTPVEYYFSAQATNGVVVNNPLLAPVQHHSTLVASDLLESQLLVADGAGGDNFGISVAVSGGVAVVGAFGDDDNGSSAGSACVFRRIGPAWIEEQKLKASDGAAGDSFGFAVALSGGVAVVGAFGDDDHGSSAGSAYVFRYDGSTWVQEQKLLASDGAAADLFGISVAVDGDVAVIGADLGGDMGSRSGCAYVFRYDGSAWVQEQNLLSSDGAPNDAFGISVGSSGDVVVVGAYAHDDGGSDAGAAYVFRYGGSAWVQEQKLLASDGAASDYFGISVAVGGDVAVVGAFRDDDNGSGSGSAYVFGYNGSAWIESQKLLAADGANGDAFGGAVALSGDVAVIGASGDSDHGVNSGSAYVFKHQGSSWVQAQKLVAPGGAAGDYFGFAAAVSRNVAVIGAWLDDGSAADSGSAMAFQTLCACPFDLDGDGNVGITEFLAVLAAWGTSPGGPPDFDGDGIVGPSDFQALGAAWGPCP